MLPILNGRKFSVEDGGGATEDIVDIVNMKHVTYSESDIMQESFTNILGPPRSVLSKEGSGSTGGNKGSFTKNNIKENYEKQEENKPVKLSETFKQLFLAQSDTKQPKSAISSDVFNPAEASPSPQTSLPWININWLQNVSKSENIGEIFY